MLKAARKKCYITYTEKATIKEFVTIKPALQRNPTHRNGRKRYIIMMALERIDKQIIIRKL
jgi:hypothetical protein